jgi:hypothetical protein
MAPEREPAASGDGERGAYGIRLDGVAEAARLLGPAAATWPRYEIRNRVVESAGEQEDRVDDARAELALRTGGRLVVDRAGGTIEFLTPRRLTPAELVHPFLAPAAAVVARWLGRDAFHAGAFAVDGAVLALLADRDGGKTSTLAWLAEQGCAVVCDDMLVLDGGRALPGPRTLDLRADAAERLGAGDYLGVAGARERWRLEVPPADGEPPLGGWVFLEWGDAVELEPLAGAERLARLLPHAGLRLPPVRPESFLELAERPAWVLRRPREWGSLADAGERLLAAVAAR